MTDQGAVLLGTGVTTARNNIFIGKLEKLVSLPPGASCPHQWLPSQYMPVSSSQFDGVHGWFAVGVSESGLGGTVYRLDWPSLRAERWFQLPKGDMVLTVSWTKTKGWQAITVGGNPDCGDLPSWDQIAARCAAKTGILYLVDESGRSTQLLTPGAIGRCEASFNPTGDALVFRESNQCFMVTREEVGSRIVVVDLANGLSWSVPGEESQFAPAWSPNGKWIAFVAEVKMGSLEMFPDASIMLTAGQVRAVNIQHRQVITLSQPGTGIAYWSPDGRKIAWFRTTNTTSGSQLEVLEILDLNESKMTEITSLNKEGDHLWAMDWSPKGDVIEWGVNSADRGLEFGFRDLREANVRNLDTGAIHEKTWPRWSHDGNTIGLIRDTENKSFLDLISWSDFSITATVELPLGVNWKDLYWISKR